VLDALKAKATINRPAPRQSGRGGQAIHPLSDPIEDNLAAVAPDEIKKK
jgi:hypothetical protein